MGLAPDRHIPANLADDITGSVDVYKADILWHSQVREVYVFALGGRPPIGMLMLDGSGMDTQFTEGDPSLWTNSENPAADAVSAALFHPEGNPHESLALSARGRRDRAAPRRVELD